MTRVLSAIVLIPVVFGIIWFLTPFWTLVFAELILIRAVYEYSELLARTNVRCSRFSVTTAAVIVCAAFSIAPHYFPVVLMAMVIAIALIELARSDRQSIIVSVSTSTLALLYLAIPIGALVALRLQHGREVLLLLLLTIIVSDTFQYYGGSTFGRRLLAPAISPKKTVAGAVFGIVAGVLVLVIVGRWWLPNMDVVSRILLGATMTSLGIVGDLFESSLKRTAAIKDSSSIIPGHGGVLDRLDGLVFAVPVYYVVMQLTR